MDLEELRKRRQLLNEATNATLNNMTIIENEAERVADVAHNAKEILDNLDEEFEKQTGLNGSDMAFLFFATAMQCARIFLMNKLTQIEKAGQGNKKEDFLHKVQNKVLKNFDDGKQLKPKKYYAPRNQIIFGRGVPYDVTAYGSDKIKELKIFKGANHRFATIGHDPIIGLIVGTTNILTNTITCVKTPIVSTFHVSYDANLIGKTLKIQDPQISSPASTILALKYVTERCLNDTASVVAAVIKQIIHIGTDLYTPMGIQLPAANLILSNKNVEQLTSYISTGDVIKAGASAGLSVLINFLISTVHSLMYDETKYSNRDVYNVKTRKIIMYSNTIASASNIIWVGANMLGGNEAAVKDLDIGGIIITINRLLTDTEFIRKVKEEFVLGGFNKLIQGEELHFEEIKLWD